MIRPSRIHYPRNVYTPIAYILLKENDRTWSNTLRRMLNSDYVRDWNGSNRQLGLICLIGKPWTFFVWISYAMTQAIPAHNLAQYVKFQHNIANSFDSSRLNPIQSNSTRFEPSPLEAQSADFNSLLLSRPLKTVTLTLLGEILLRYALLISFSSIYLFNMSTCLINFLQPRTLHMTLFFRP
jgi:hypothetical protein